MTSEFVTVPRVPTEALIAAAPQPGVVNELVMRDLQWLAKDKHATDEQRAIATRAISALTAAQQPRDGLSEGELFWLRDAANSICGPSGNKDHQRHLLALADRLAAAHVQDTPQAQAGGESGDE